MVTKKADLLKECADDKKVLFEFEVKWKRE